MQEHILNSILKNKLFKNSSCIAEDFKEMDLELHCTREAKILFRKGEQVESIFLIQSGEINHFVESEKEGTKVIPYFESDFIPHDFTKSPVRKSTAIAVRDTYYYKLSEQELNYFLFSNEEVKKNYEEFIDKQAGLNLDQPSLEYIKSEETKPEIEKEEKPAETEIESKDIPDPPSEEADEVEPESTEKGSKESEKREEVTEETKEEDVKEVVEESKEITDEVKELHEEVKEVPVENKDLTNEIKDTSVETEEEAKDSDEVSEDIKEDTKKGSINDLSIDIIKGSVNTNNEFDVVEHGDISILFVNLKEATMAHTPKLKIVLNKLIDNGTKKLIVDLDTCDIIDSTFLGTLVVILKRIANISGEMRLVCGNKPAWMIFEMTGMGKVFNTSKTLKSALEEFYT